MDILELMFYVVKVTVSIQFFYSLNTSHWILYTINIFHVAIASKIKLFSGFQLLIKGDTQPSLYYYAVQHFSLLVSQVIQLPFLLHHIITWALTLALLSTYLHTRHPHSRIIPGPHDPRIPFLNGITYTTIWMDLENSMLSEVNLQLFENYKQFQTGYRLQKFQLLM